MKSPPLRRRASGRAALLVLVLAVLTLLAVACASEAPDMAQLDGMGEGGAATGVGGVACGTPQEGCPCVEPGMRVECGKVTRRSEDGDYVACSMGTRQCLDGAWGTCVGETEMPPTSTKRFVAGGGLNIRALGASAACGSGDAGGPSDPCDPYCFAFVDTPVGIDAGPGLAIVDGGLTVAQPDAGNDAGGPAVFQSTANGVITCGGATNLVQPSCTAANAATNCQQDHRCDTASGTCRWNGGPGYWDPSAAGPDLTISAPCGASGSGSAYVAVCNRGSASAANGAMITFHVTNAAPGGCSTGLGAPTYQYALGQALAPGACQMFTLPNATGNKFLTVNAGNPGAVAEGAGRCANNSAPLKDDGAPGCAACNTCSTTLTGKVYDPSGAGAAASNNNIPLAGVSVFQPANATLPALTEGVGCESCASLEVPAVARAVTDATGAFTLTGVSAGPNTPIVVQSGRWRRKINVNVATMCGPNTVPNGTLRMPRNRTEGDIPKTELVMSDNESLECLLRKIGIDASEFAPYSAAAPQRIRLFRNNGMNTSPGAPTSMTAMFNALNEHAQVIFDCDGGGAYNASSLWSNTTAAQKTALQTYTAAGGKVFMDHLPGQLFLNGGSGAPSPFSTVATWNTNVLSQRDDPNDPARGKVITGTTAQATFSAWLNNVSAMMDWGSPFIKSDVPRYHAITNATGTTTWVRGKRDNNFGAGNGDYTLSFSFEMGRDASNTPALNATCGVPSASGRVIFNGMHVSEARSNTYPARGGFPADCNLGPGLTSEEKALEYHLFQLTACALGGAPPPPPPVPPPPLTAQSYYRDYQAVCKPGERPVWAPFYWEGIFPAGTSVDLRAATADTQAALPPSPPVEATSALVANASRTVVAPAWDCSGCPATPETVDRQLKDDLGQPSKSWLRIYMRFNPTTTLAPTLTSWRQVYDCIPSE